MSELVTEIVGGEPSAFVPMANTTRVKRVGKIVRVTQTGVCSFYTTGDTTPTDVGNGV